jgi:hypothetical protein
MNCLVAGTLGPLLFSVGNNYFGAGPIINCKQESYKTLAVRVGFEPTEPAKVQRFSRPPDSTTLAPHQA